MLLGRSPKQVFEGVVKVREAMDETPGPPAVPSGLPSELLLRRPDLVEAERQHGSVIRAFRALHMKPSPQGAFVSLPGGVEELVEALVARLEGQQHQVKTNEAFAQSDLDAS